MSSVDVWRRHITDVRKWWVLFDNGTCVILVEPGDDLAAPAVALMKERGPVHPGSPAGDFGVIVLPDGFGWVVTGHHDARPDPHGVAGGHAVADDHGLGLKKQTLMTGLDRPGLRCDND